MRMRIALFLFVAFCALPIAGKQGRPIPPGIRVADAQTNKPLEPPVTARLKSLDAAKLKQEADELAQLSAGVPSDVSLVARGQLPKDLAVKLKRIEKLAKHLRNELSQ